MLELRHVQKIYNPGTVNEMCLFTDFNLKIEKGEFVSIVGSNGSGKTSMLNILCGSIPIESGQICIGGEDVAKQKAAPPDWARIPKSGDGNVPFDDDFGKYGLSGQQGKEVWTGSRDQ